jgi:hypothetical protein
MADLQVWILYAVCGVGYDGRSAGLESLRSVWCGYGGRSAGLELLRSVWEVEYGGRSAGSKLQSCFAV